MQLLGDSQISMTMHDTHVVPELAEEAAARMDGALCGPVEPLVPEDGTEKAPSGAG